MIQQWQKNKQINKKIEEQKNINDRNWKKKMNEKLKEIEMNKKLKHKRNE